MHAILGSTRTICFRSSAPAGRQQEAKPFVVKLSSAKAGALSQLLPLLGCGEEAAALAFDALADGAEDDAASIALRTIADEEQVHKGLIAGLIVALPPPHGQAAVLRAAQRFHIRLAAGGNTAHLAKIAAVDAAVCTVLSRLLRPRAPLTADAGITAILRRIHRDEARHVRVSRVLAGRCETPPRLDALAEPARVALANVLGLAGDAFEVLGVDPRTLLDDCGRLPRGLFAT